MDIERRPAVRRGAKVNIEQLRSKIGQNQGKVQEFLEPHSFRGRLRKNLVAAIPFSSIRGALAEAPLEDAIDEMRGPTIDLYNNMGEIIREGRELVQFHSDVRGLLDEATAHPEDEEVIRELRNKLREKAERDLNLKRNSDTEDLLEQVLEPNDPTRKAQIREKTIFEANQVLKVSETIANVGDNIATNTAQTFEAMMAQYAILLNIRGAVRILHKSGSDLMNAHILRIQAFNTLTGQIDTMLATASLATEVQQLASEAQVTVDAEQIESLRLRAEALKQQTFKILPATEENDSQKLLKEADTSQK